MTEYLECSADSKSGPVHRAAPSWAPWALVLAPLIGLFAAVSGLAIGVLVVPVFDPAPWLVWLLVRRIDRWDGVSHRLLHATKIVAAIMMGHWILVYGWLLLASTFAHGSRLQWFIEIAGSTWSLYLLEVAVLVVMLIVACAASLASLIRLRRPSRTAITPSTNRLDPS